MKTSRVSTLLAVLAFVSVAALLSTPASALPPPPFSDISAGLTAVDDSSVAWGDYDADGDLDILLTGNKGNGTSEIWENNDGASFSKHATLATQVYYGSAAWGDYDTDGDLDVLLSGMSNSLVPVTQIFENAAGVFSRDTDADAGLPGVWHGSVAWGDYNADGKPDILITGNPVYPGTPAPISKVFKNDGDGTFSEVTGTSLVPVYYSSVAWGDYNADGYPDILLTGQTTGSVATTKIYKNNGDGTFGEDAGAESGLTSVSGSSVAWGDYNSDGYPDILLMGSSSTGGVSKIYRNNGNGTFSEDTTADISLAGVSYGSAAWGDYNADGRLDILLTGMSGSSSVSNLYQNNSDGTFGEDTAADGSLTGVDWSSVAWGDFGAKSPTPTGTPDGRLDLLLTGNNGTTFYSAVYQRSTEIVVTNDPPSAPSGLSASYASGVETLSWSASTDSEQAGTPNGLTYNVRVGTTPGGSQIVSPLSLGDGARLVAQFGNAGWRTSYLLKNLSAGTYYWSVQAVDNGFAGSSFPAEGSFTVQPVFSLSSSTYPVSEGDGAAQIIVNRGGLTTGVDTVHVTTSGGNASAGSDYTSVDQDLTFTAGEARKTISVGITDDSSVESSETLQVALSGAAAPAILGTPSSATLTINDNDVAPTQTTPPTPPAKGKIVSAKLSKKSFTAAQAKTVKLTVKFSPKSKKFNYLLQVKKNGKWVKVKAVNRSGSFTTKTMTVKSIFAGKAVLKGAYRLKLSADRNSRALSFRVT